MSETYYGAPNDFRGYLIHYGVKGMHWGVRRYQNPDGSLTPAGKDHYGKREGYPDKDKLRDFFKDSEDAWDVKKISLKSISKPINSALRTLNKDLSKEERRHLWKNLEYARAMHLYDDTYEIYTSLDDGHDMVFIYDANKRKILTDPYTAG